MCNPLAYTCYFVLLVVTACGSLTYVPVKTPDEFMLKRREAITEQLKADFSRGKMKYVSLAFGKSVLLKPPSHFTLDSLYSLKYELEKSNRVSDELEEQIRIQQVLAGNDTMQTYYLEKHVFSVEDSVKYEVFLADLYVNPKHKIESVEIRESAEIARKDARMYAAYVLRESFIYLHTEADEAEEAFYALYESRLNSLGFSEKQDFLNFMLSVMRTANRYSRLDKSFLIKEYTRLYVQGPSRNMLGERFIKMEEYLDEKNELLYYYVDYECSMPNERQEMMIMRFEVYLDPWLQLVEIRKKS